MKIYIHAGYYAERWDCETEGLGGTEQCIINLANQLVNQGHTVFVIGEVHKYFRAHPNGGHLHYVHLDTDGLPDPDVIIGVGYLHYLKYYDYPNAKKIFWLHNEEPYYWYKGEIMSSAEIQKMYDETDMVVCLTEWHKEYFLNNEPYFIQNVTVIGNGIDTSKIVAPKEKIFNSYVYTSHPERGLDVFLKDLGGFEDAELHICTPSYGLEYFEEFYAERVSGMPNVTYHGNLPVQDLYKLLSQMEVWYYPTEYNETYCITALEMLAHNVKPLVNAKAGLKETLNGFNKNITDWDPVNKYVDSRDWKEVSKEWISLFNKIPLKMPEFKMPESWKPYVDMTYIITLDPEGKKEELTERFHSFGMTSNLKIWPASNGHTGRAMSAMKHKVADWWKIEHTNPWWHRDVKPGEVGCALSHLRIWEDAIRANHKRILILEEDFSVKRKWNPSDVETERDWTLMYLGHKFQEEPKEKVTETLVKPGYTYNTHAYMLTNEGCRLLLEQNFHEYIFPVDEFLSATFTDHPRSDLDFIYQDTRALAVVPEFIGQTSNVHNSTTERASKLKDYEYTQFCNEFVTYSARLKDSALIVDEPIQDVFTFPLFTEEFCVRLIQEAEESGLWTKNRHDFYPTTDMLINELGLQDYYDRILKDYVYPIAIDKWKLEGKQWTTLKSENFIIKYEEDVQGHLSLHHDSAAISCVLALNEEYEGGGTYFWRQQKLHKGKTGNISIHPAVITHRHGARPVTKGKRFVLVSFCKYS